MELDKDFNLLVGLRIREIRESLHMSREDFSEKCELSASFLADVERGKKSITIKTLYKICTTYHISCDYIVFGHNQGYDTDLMIELLSDLDTESKEQAVTILSAFVTAIKAAKGKE